MNWKTFLILDEICSMCFHTTSWMALQTSTSELTPESQKIFFGWVVVMVKFSIYLHILCEVTAPSVVFLPPFLPPGKASSPV